jgi:hypothetical protein
MNKYDFKFPNFNKNIDEGIKQYERRIERFKKNILNLIIIYYILIFLNIKLMLILADMSIISSI